MPQVLHLPHLVQHDGVADVDVRRGRVEPELDPQRLAGRPGALQLGGDFGFDQEFVRAAFEYLELVFDVDGHCGTGAPESECSPAVC